MTAAFAVTEALILTLTEIADLKRAALINVIRVCYIQEYITTRYFASFEA